jgi:hypothetical protein
MRGRSNLRDRRSMSPNRRSPGNAGVDDRRRDGGGSAFRRIRSRCAPGVGPCVAFRSPRFRPPAGLRFYRGEVIDSSPRPAVLPSSGAHPSFLEHAPCRLRPSRWVVDGVEEVEAYLICLDCRVRADCRAYALNSPDLSGIWAATTKQEREHLRRRWESIAAPTEDVGKHAGITRLVGHRSQVRPARASRRLLTLASGLGSALRRKVASSGDRARPRP